MTIPPFISYSGAADARFDIGYDRGTHTPLVKAVWSPSEARVLKGVEVPGGGEASLVATCEVVFPSHEALDADVALFTNVSPVAQISEPLS